MNRLNDPYEQTPESFHLRVEQTLGELRRAEPPKRYARRLSLAVVLGVVLLIGTALALESMGVLHFFTQRYEQPIDAQTIIQPTSQSCDSKLLDATLRDAYWDGETLSISLNVHPRMRKRRSTLKPTWEQTARASIKSGGRVRSYPLTNGVPDARPLS